MTPKDRKQRIEQVLAKAQDLDSTDAAMAWGRLCDKLCVMTDPESRPPRFDELLSAIWEAANEQS